MNVKLLRKDKSKTALLTEVRQNFPHEDDNKDKGLLTLLEKDEITVY